MKKKDRQIKSNWTKQRLFLRPNSRKNKQIYKTLLELRIQSRRSSLTFYNLTHSSCLIKSKSITLRIVNTLRPCLHGVGDPALVG